MTFMQRVALALPMYIGLPGQRSLDSTNSTLMSLHLSSTASRNMKNWDLTFVLVLLLINKPTDVRTGYS